MACKFHVVQRQNKDGRLGLPVCQLDTSGMLSGGWDMKSVNEEGGGGGDRVMIGLVQSAYRGRQAAYKERCNQGRQRERT
jgi:hypothetical protein